MNKDIIIFDIDGTLSLVGDRRECLERNPKHWDEFYGRCGEDLPNEPIIEVFRGLARLHKYKLIFVTGRSENCRTNTLAWSDRQGLFIQPEAPFQDY